MGVRLCQRGQLVLVGAYLMEGEHDWWISASCNRQELHVPQIREVTTCILQVGPTKHYDAACAATGGRPPTILRQARPAGEEVGITHATIKMRQQGMDAASYREKV